MRKLGGRVNLLARFGLITLVLVAVLGIVLGSLVQASLKNRTVGDAVRTAEVAANIGVRPVLRPSDLQHDFLPLPAARRAELDAALLDNLSRNNIVRVKIWNAQHFVVWSDNARLLQRWFPGDDELNESFQGKVAAEVTDLRSPEELDDRANQRLLSVYLPLRVGTDGHFTDDPNAKIIGAFEIYLAYQPIAHAIDHDTRRLYLTLAIGLALLYLVVFRIVARASRDLRRQAATNRHQALYDILTDLPNRTLFTDRLDQVARQSLRNGTVAAALLLDLDRFKEINDALGHESGDQLLQQIGARIAKRLRAQDTVARLGGDEFGIVLPGLAHAEDAVVVAEDIAFALEETFEIDGIEIDVRASIGVACTDDDDGADAAALLRHADVAMYVAKRARSGIEKYSVEHDLFSVERLALASEIRRAIEQHELVLHYQPKIDLRTGRADAVEALVRWQHPTRGLLGPGEFLPVVESTHLIKPLTLYVLDEALRQVRAWLDAGDRVRVAVNLAAAYAGDTRLPSYVAEMLARHDVDPALLEIELTETAVLDDPARTKQVLNALSELGVRSSVDDFGTGYASVAYLTGLPISTLKIDQSFILDLARPGNLAVTRYSIDLARTLGLTTVAEGVEDEANLRVLQELGCDEAQGFFFARPTPPDVCIAWIPVAQRDRGHAMNLAPVRRFAATALLVTLTGTILTACGSSSNDNATSPVTVFNVSADPSQIVPTATPGHHAPLTVAALHSALDSLLATHATLIAVLMHEVGAGNEHPTTAVNALAANTQGLIDAIDAVYGADGARAFAQLWEQHTQFFIDYSQAARDHDNGAKKEAISRLTDYQNDFASFVTTATGGGAPLVAVTGLLHTHVDDLTNYINADVDGRAAAARDLLAQAIAHMHVIAKAIADAIALQHLKTVAP